jgi:hypothetical protein
MHTEAAMPTTVDPRTRPSSGPVPAAYAALLAWEWTGAMPAPLRRSRFLALLYVLHDRADEFGDVRPRHGVDIDQDLARGACLAVEDAARYLAAAVAAGIVVRRPPTGYALAPSAVPDWDAAASHLTLTAPAPERTPTP